MTAMNSEIKKYADSGDLRSLKYVFVDALDVDPTFARYEEEYNYCKSIPGLLESHIELTPFHADPAAWTEDYWVELKMDLLKNFSDQRMTHMREVAKGLLEDKVRRILEERAAAQKQAAPPTQVPEGAFAAPAAEAQEAPQAEKTPGPKSAEHAADQAPSQGSMAAEQERQLEQARKELEVHNRAVEVEQQRREAERRKEHEAGPYVRDEAHGEGSGEFSKKAVGIAVAAAAVAAVVVLILVLK